MKFLDTILKASSLAANLTQDATNGEQCVNGPSQKILLIRPPLGKSLLGTLEAPHLPQFLHHNVSCRLHFALFLAKIISTAFAARLSLGNCLCEQHGSL
jgi:hypothetical protein